jgi:hypothetical protein
MKDLLRRYLTDEQIAALMRDLAQQRRRVESTCAECGTAIEGTTRRRYCGTACKQRAYRRSRQATAG